MPRSSTSLESSSPILDYVQELHRTYTGEFEPLALTHPRIKIVLFTNMALGIADRLPKATRAMSVFD